jgi:hypothetical protein
VVTIDEDDEDDEPAAESDLDFESTDEQPDTEPEEAKPEARSAGVSRREPSSSLLYCNTLISGQVMRRSGVDFARLPRPGHSHRGRS